MARAGKSCSWPETLSTPAPQEDSGVQEPSVALGLSFLLPQLAAPEFVVLDSSPVRTHLLLLLSRQRKRGGCPAEKCRQFLARLQQR